MRPKKDSRSSSAYTRPQPPFWTHIGWDLTLRMEEMNQTLSVRACTSYRCSLEALGVGTRKGWRSRSHAASASPLQRLSWSNLKGDISWRFRRNSNIQTQRGTSKGYTSWMDSGQGTCYNASHSTRRVFHALTLRWATPSVTSSSPRSISFVILPMAIVLPARA